MTTLQCGYTGLVLCINLHKREGATLIEAKIGWGIKNILRIYKAGLARNVKNTEPRPKFPYSYKKKSVYIPDGSCKN